MLQTHVVTSHFCVTLSQAITYGFAATFIGERQDNRTEVKLDLRRSPSVLMAGSDSFQLCAQHGMHKRDSRLFDATTNFALTAHNDAVKTSETDTNIKLGNSTVDTTVIHQVN